MATDATRYAREYETIGASNTHKQVLQWVTRGARVLEVGCSSGYVGRSLIRENGCHVTGVEVDANAAKEARANGLEVIEGSLEDAAFRASLPGGFDFVVATDVLEHLREPAAVLADFPRWLAPSGQAIIAVPNIANWDMRRRLFFDGDFEYQETGILDRTHVHFFTWDTLHALVERQGWTVMSTQVEEWELPIGRDLFVIAPRTIRRWVERFGAREGDAVHRVATGIQERGSAIAEHLYRRWPNLTAKHISLLLRPPARTPLGEVSHA